MDEVSAFLTAILIALFGLIVAAIAMVEHGARVALSTVGIHGQVQTALLALLLLALIVLAFRCFGHVFGLLVAVILVLVLLHALLTPVIHPHYSV
jgi:hypothetical protein